MDFKDYFEPVQVEKFIQVDSLKDNQLGSKFQFSIDDDDLPHLVLFSVEEDRGASNNKGCALGGNAIRKYLYKLHVGSHQLKMVDLGIVKAGNSITDTYFAVKDIVSQLLRNGVIPIVIGGSQDLAYGNYLAYTNQEQLVNMVHVSSKFSLGEADEVIHSKNFFSKILLHHPNVLFNYSNLAYQTYFIDQKEIALLDELFFDNYRLGLVKNDLQKVEPIIRNADFICFSANAISQIDAPANEESSPNGLSGEQACQLARYAGMSDKLSSIGFYDFNPTIQDRGQTAHLFAQMIWYFIDGYYHRKGDFPNCNKNEYFKYTVSLDEGKQEIVFYKSGKSDRWWMEIPYSLSFKTKYERHLMLPCDYEDYLTATNNEIPERWFQTFKKLK